MLAARPVIPASRYAERLARAADATTGADLDALLIGVGPDLRSVGGHPPEKLLSNILDPSADVQPGFHAYQCHLEDGTELYGLIAAETGNSIIFKLADATTRVVLRTDIAELRGANVSLMPEGLEAGLSHQDMADLIHLLRATPPAP